MIEAVYHHSREKMDYFVNIRKNIYIFLENYQKHVFQQKEHG